MGHGPARRNKEIQFAIHANYGSNVDRYPEWHEYFRRSQPPAVITWGRNDPIFTVRGALAYAKDLAVAETHLLDAGHFALETHAYRYRDDRARFPGALCLSAQSRFDRLIDGPICAALLQCAEVVSDKKRCKPGAAFARAAVVET